MSKADWQRYLRELVTLGYLQASDGEYPVLMLTGKSEAVLKGRQQVELTLSQTTEEARYETLPHEADLLDKLKLIRTGIANNENVPAYIILSDATLLELATYLPQTMEELRQISGFGEVKLARYGEAFLNAVVGYCDEMQLSSKIK